MPRLILSMLAIAVAASQTFHGFSGRDWKVVS